jgi:shikimate kinase
MNEHIFLIGYRATGKSTIGRLLAKRLRFDFVDTDRLICKTRNTEISSIVAKEGWEAFRRYEAEALSEAAGGARRVVATGGGAILHREQWQQIREKALVVWLSADLATLVARLSRSGKGNAARPSLTGGAIHAEIEVVLAERTPLYRESSHLQVDTGKVGTAKGVEIIADAYRKRYGGSNG